jgi:hypothetical protein
MPVREGESDATVVTMKRARRNRKKKEGTHTRACTAPAATQRANRGEKRETRVCALLGATEKRTVTQREKGHARKRRKNTDGTVPHKEKHEEKNEDSCEGGRKKQSDKGAAVCAMRRATRRAMRKKD